MGKRTESSAELASTKTSTIHIYGAQPDDELILTLKKSFSGVQLFPGPVTAPFHNADLAIGIREGNDGDAMQVFTRSAYDAGVPSLRVEFRDTKVLIGPLTLRDRAGCGRCAFERLTAAAVASETPFGNGLPQLELARIAGPALVCEIQAIETHGPERSQLVDHIMAIDGETLVASLHKVIPLARCNICGGASAYPIPAQDPLRLSPQDSPEAVVGALAGWVDLLTGVISNLYIEPPSDLGVELPIIATAAPTHIIEEDGSLRRLALGWGKGLTISGAVLSAVGEAIERYSASLPDAGRIIWKRVDELDGEFLDPSVFSFYTDAQYERDSFPYVRFDKNIPHPWVAGQWLNNGDPVWVPALLAFLSFSLWPEQLFYQGTSNGLASSTDMEDAALRATLELVERDAFMTAWLTASPGRRVALDESLDPLLHDVLKGIEALGATVEVYLLPVSACGATALCLGLGDGKHYPGATIGLGADLDPRLALRQAILELGQTGPYLRRMMREEALPIPLDAASVREMLDHALYYFPRERAAAFDWLRNSASPIALRDLSEELTRSVANCASQLEAAAIRVALVDVTAADVATGPFRVVRAVSPDLQSISYGYGFDLTPVERIRTRKLASEVPAVHPIW